MKLDTRIYVRYTYQCKPKTLEHIKRREVNPMNSTATAEPQGATLSAKILCPWRDCVHSACQLYRREITRFEYVDRLVWNHWDTNWGRFETDDQRTRVHALLVADSL
jgi:hypothetical protein